MLSVKCVNEMADITVENKCNSNSNFGTPSSCKTYLETIQQIELLIKQSSSTTQVKDLDELKYQILLRSLFECSYPKDNMVHQNEHFISILKTSVPMLHGDIRKYLFTNDNIGKINIVINHGPTVPFVNGDNGGDFSRRFYTNYFNTRDHLVKFISDEFLTVFKETHKMIYDDLCHCTEILLIALLIHEYEQHFAKINNFIKPPSPAEEKVKLKADYPEFFKGIL